MKDEYDFSNAERGRFFREDVRLNLPVYLDDEVMAFVQDIARKHNTDASAVVNRLIRTDMQLADVIK